MRIVFLGAFTEYKKLLILAMTRVISTEYSVKIYSNHHYSYEDESGSIYDFCKAEIHKFDDEIQLMEALRQETCDYAFIDSDQDTDAGSDAKIVAIVEPERTLFEQATVQIKNYISRHPFTNFHVVFANILEFCKVNGTYLDRLYERALNDTSNISKRYELFFDEQNASVFQESMYEEKLILRKLSPVWKLQVAGILSDLTGIGIKDMKKYLKKAERMK